MKNLGRDVEKYDRQPKRSISSANIPVLPVENGSQRACIPRTHFPLAVYSVHHRTCVHNVYDDLVYVSGGHLWLCKMGLCTFLNKFTHAHWD